MKLIKALGVTSEIWQLFIQDSSSTTGAGLTGLAFGTSGLTAYYHRDADTTATAITLVTMTVGTFTSSGFKEIDAINMPGWYQFCPPNAALASGAKSCGFHLKGAANMAPLPIEVQLAAVNPDSASAFITGVNSLAPPSNWNLLSINASGHIARVVLADTTTAVTNDVGITQAGADKAWASASRTLTSFGTLVADIATAVWAATTRILTAGTNIVLAKGVGLTGLNDLSEGDVRDAVGMASPDLDTQLNALGTAIVSRATPAQVKTQVVAALSSDTYGEPAGAPGATVSITAKVGFLYMVLRNKLTVTGSAKTFYDDAGASQWSKALADNGTTYQENEGS